MASPFSGQEVEADQIQGDEHILTFTEHALEDDIGTTGAYYSHHDTCEHRNTVRAEATTTREFVHINPYLLQEPKGVYDKKIVMDDNGGRLFLRVDMPGLEENNYAAACNDNRDVTFQGRERFFAVLGGEG